MRNEKKCYGIRRMRGVCKSKEVLSTVSVTGEGGSKSYVNIKFDEPFVEAIGKRMPQGVSVGNPAFLHVLHTGKKWQVWVQYANDFKVSVLLWETAVEPKWLKPLKEKNADQESQEEPSVGSHSYGSDAGDPENNYSYD